MDCKKQTTNTENKNHTHRYREHTGGYQIGDRGGING